VAPPDRACGALDPSGFAQRGPAHVPLGIDESGCTRNNLTAYDCAKARWFADCAILGGIVMKSFAASLVLAACAGLAGCQTSQWPAGVSFAPPVAASALSNDSASVQATITKANARTVELLNAADKVANAPQYLDLPTIGAGLAAIAGGAFGAPGEIAKGAAVAAAGLVAHRTYWNFGGRQGALLQAASGEACIAGAGRGIVAIDQQTRMFTDPSTGQPTNLWLQAAGWATQQIQSDPSDPMATKVLALEPIVMSAPQSLDGARLGVEIALRKKLATPSAPDISSLAATYQSALAGAAGAGQSNANAAGNASALLAGQAGGHGANLSAGQQAAAIVLSDPGVLNNLTSLTTTLTACVALAS
jgi:hypothetical protein